MQWEHLIQALGETGLLVTTGDLKIEREDLGHGERNLHCQCVASFYTPNGQRVGGATLYALVTPDQWAQEADWRVGAASGADFCRLIFELAGPAAKPIPHPNAVQIEHPAGEPHTRLAGCTCDACTALDRAAGKATP